MNIGAKMLASLNSANFCPRCLYIKVKFDLPFQIFGPLYNLIDHQTKASIRTAFDQGHPPQWLLDGLGNVSPVPTPTLAQFTVVRGELMLRGVPDALFRRDDGTLAIIDYKCSKHNEAYVPLYVAQLNAYAYLAAAANMPRVSKLALVYTEAVADALPDAGFAPLTADGIAMKFKARIVPVPLQPDLIPRLLIRAEEILAGPLPPTGDGCKDCELLQQLAKLCTAAEPVIDPDQLLVAP